MRKGILGVEVTVFEIVPIAFGYANHCGRIFDHHLLLHEALLFRPYNQIDLTGQADCIV